MLALALLLGWPRASIPAHLLHHPVEVVPELISPATAAKLRASILSMGSDKEGFPDVAKGVGQPPYHDNIGEATQLQGVVCTHPFLVPNENRTRCVLPGRIDVGRHFILSGGAEGMKEQYEDMVSRVSAFMRYMFNLDDHPEVQALFEESKFVAAARKVCPRDKQVLDPFQFNYLIQVPGQTVALHLDAPYFWGANRFHLPQWLLVVMVFSGLFQEQFVDQVQIVGYLHDWDPASKGPLYAGRTQAGDFLYYNQGSASALPTAVPPMPRAGNAVDGSKTLHAASIYQPHRKAPLTEKSASTSLHYVPLNNSWEVRSGGRVAGAFAPEELRISIVYRARCFSNQTEVERYQRELRGPPEDLLSVEHVLKVLEDDLQQRGRLSEERRATISRLDLAMALLDEYVKYPLPPLSYAWLPLNYCALPRIMPWTKPLLGLVC